MRDTDSHRCPAPIARNRALGEKLADPLARLATTARRTPAPRTPPRFRAAAPPHGSIRCRIRARENSTRATPASISAEIGTIAPLLWRRIEERESPVNENLGRFEFPALYGTANEHPPELRLRVACETPGRKPRRDIIPVRHRGPDPPLTQPRKCEG